MDVNSATSQPLNNSTPINHLPRRRNGQEQACEPCRKAKVKCDHGLPTCLKCTQRKKPLKCVYLAAPMSQPKRLRRNSGSVTPISPRPLRSPEADISQSPLLASRSQEPETSTTSDAPDHTSGFFSSTSFPAIVKENFVETFGPLPSSESSETVMVKHNPTQHMSSEQVEGVRILRQLPNRQTWDALIEWLPECEEASFHRPTIRHIASSLWATFGHYLEEPRNLHSLELVVQEIIHNSSKPLKEPDDYHEWLATFSGPNLRWEALGIVLNKMAYSCVILSETAETMRAERGTRKPSKSFATELKSSAEAIIDILRRNETMNSLVVVLLSKNLHLGTLFHGDTSFSIWRQHGDVVGALTAINGHRDDGTNNSSLPEMVTISQQVRRRLFNFIYMTDKSLALFNGRPPILSQRYCSCPLPLDLPDEAYMHGKEYLLREVRDLDVNGWNRKDDTDIQDMAFVRVVGLFCKRLEELLEILLGNQEQFSDERLNNLKVRTDQTYASLPPHLKFLRVDLHQASHLPPARSDQIKWFALNCRLEYLRMTFLIERLSTERSSLPQNRSRQKLLDISRDMLDNTLYLWLQRDRFKHKLHDYDYLLMCHGMPSAGILCVELLRSIKQTTTEGDEERDRIRLPQSEVVQNLSLLVGFLDWVRPSAGNYKLCGRMRQIIQRVLDMVLDPTSNQLPKKRPRLEPQSRYLQPDLLPDRRPKEREHEARDHGQGEGQRNEGNIDSSYGTSGVLGDSETGISDQNHIYTAMGPGIVYEGAASVGFGAGVENGVLSDDFLLDAGLENLDWLDTVDWTRGPWIDLN